MSLIRSLASKRRARVVTVILLLGKIMPTYSRYVLKGLVCVAIIALLGHQPFFYAKYTKLNMRLFCDIKLVSNTKYACLMRSYILRSLRLPYLICLRVLYNSYCGETRL